MQLKTQERALISNVGSGRSFGIVLLTVSFDAIMVVELGGFGSPFYVKLKQ